MFRVSIFMLLLLVGTSSYAQQEKQADTTVNHHIPLIKANKADLLNNVDVIFNTQIGLNNSFSNGTYLSSKFEVNQFRFEIRGRVLEDKVFFRFRDRYTRDPQVQSVDNLSRSTDLAFIGYTISDRVNIAIGKMTANWGGYEFDMNPIDIYQYNDIVDNADNFLTGVQLNWKLNAKHTLSAQVLNSRTKTFTELYHDIPEFKEAKFPAAYVGTWNGNFADGKFQTIWSFSIFEEASKNGKPVNMYYTALGNQLQLKDWLLQYDFKWSAEELDRKGIVSSITGSIAQNVDYKEHWLRAVYALSHQWKASAIGMVSTASWDDPTDDKSGKRELRTSWGLIPVLEFYPIKNYNLKFYAAYVGRYLNYSGYAKTTLNQVDSNTGRIMLGITSPLLVF